MAPTSHSNDYGKSTRPSGHTVAASGELGRRWWRPCDVRARRAVVAVERLAVRAVDDAARVGAVGLVDIFRLACWTPRAEIAMAWAGWSCQAVVAGLLLDAVDLARARAPKGLVTLQKRWQAS